MFFSQEDSAGLVPARRDPASGPVGAIRIQDAAIGALFINMLYCKDKNA